MSETLSESNPAPSNVAYLKEQELQMSAMKKMLGDPTDAEVEQFMKEFDEGKHPLSDADKDALATGGFMRSLRAHTALEKAQTELVALRAENLRLMAQLESYPSETAKLDRNTICEIGRLFWGDNKQCYSADAVLRKVQELQSYREIAGELIGMIEVASCPNNCIDGAYLSYGDVTQCQWCDEKKTTLARWTEIEKGKG